MKDKIRLKAAICYCFFMKRYTIQENIINICENLFNDKLNLFIQKIYSSSEET